MQSASEDEDELDDERGSSDDENEDVEEDGLDVSGLRNEDLFFVDETGSNTGLEDILAQDGENVDGSAAAGYKVAWHDSDDEHIVVSLESVAHLRKLRRTEEEDRVNGKIYQNRLRQQYLKANPAPDWAVLPHLRKQKTNRSRQRSLSSSDDDEEKFTGEVVADPLDLLIKSATTYYSANPNRRHIEPGFIDIARMNDATQDARSGSPVECVHFHPTQSFVLVAGGDRQVRIFHIDGRKNPLVTAMFAKYCKLTSAFFHPDGRRIFAGGPRKFFLVWDIETGVVKRVNQSFVTGTMQESTAERFRLHPSGNYLAILGQYGYIHVLSADTGQLLHDIKVEGEVADAQWYHDGSGMCIANKGGSVWEWNLQSKNFTACWTDEGGVGITTLALGGDKDNWCAVGSQSGMINVYNRTQISPTNVAPSPLKVIGNLVTAVTAMKFSPDGQLLVIASNVKIDHLRLVHVPSFTVFQNWPTQNTPLGYILSVAWSPDSDVLSVANKSGRVTLYNIK